MCTRDNAIKFRNLEVLATLESLALVAAFNMIGGPTVAQWVGRCQSLRYLFCEQWGDLTSLVDFARAPSLISVALLHCAGINDLTALMQLDRLQCLVARNGDQLGAQPNLRAPKSVRMLAVPGSPEDWTVLRQCNSLD